MIVEENPKNTTTENSFAKQCPYFQQQRRYSKKLKTNGVSENDKYYENKQFDKSVEVLDNQKYNINKIQQFEASQQNQFKKQFNQQESKFSFDDNHSIKLPVPQSQNVVNREHKAKQNSLAQAYITYLQEPQKIQNYEPPKIQYKNNKKQKLDQIPKNQTQQMKIEVDEISVDNSINQKSSLVKTELQGLAQQIPNKQKELQDLDNKINVLQRKYKYIDSIIKLSENISNLKQKPQEIEKYKRSKSLEIDQQTILKVDNKQRTLGINQNLQIKINNIIQQKDEIESLRILVENLQQKNRILSNQSLEKVQKNLNLNSNIQNNDELIQKLEKEIEKNINKNFDLQQIIQNQTNELTELKQKFDIQNQNLNQQLCKYNLEIETQKKQIEEKNQNNQNLNSEKDKLNHCLNLQRQENERLTQEIQNLKQKIDGDQKQFLNDLKQQNDMYHSNLHDLKQKNDELQNIIKQQDQIIIDLNTKEENIRNKHLQDIQIKEKNIQDLNANIEILNTQLQDIESNKENLETELDLLHYQDRMISILITNPNSNRREVIQVKLKDSINDIYVYANLHGIYDKSPINAKVFDRSSNKSFQGNEWSYKFYQIYTPSQYNQQINLEFTDLQ